MTAIAIFVKTPGLSPVKTRLAAHIGRSRAERWHALAAQAVAERVRTTSIGPAYFAVAETEAVDHPLWSGLPTMVQGRGGLGKRMHRIHTRLVDRHGSAMLLGADAIQWRPDWLTRAAAWLNASEARWVIGPAKDGGFWTFGSNRKLPELSWTGVHYSQADTREQFQTRLDNAGAGLILPSLTDLDTIEDVAAIRAELHLASKPGNALQAAISCLEALAQPRSPLT